MIKSNIKLIKIKYIGEAWGVLTLDDAFIPNSNS